MTASPTHGTPDPVLSPEGRPRRGGPARFRGPDLARGLADAVLRADERAEMRRLLSGRPPAPPRGVARSWRPRRELVQAAAVGCASVLFVAAFAFLATSQFSSTDSANAGGARAKVEPVSLTNATLPTEPTGVPAATGAPRGTGSGLPLEAPIATVP